MKLPPLETLRVFEAAGRHQSFVKAAEELYVTPAAVANRIKILEQFLEQPLFIRYSNGIELNQQGNEYLVEIQKLLHELYFVTNKLKSDRYKKRLNIIVIEVFAEKWFMPRLASFREHHPEILINLMTDHRKIDPIKDDIDVWITYATKISDPLIAKPLLEETLLPVCSPKLFKSMGRPRQPSDLFSWPLLYDLEWVNDWADWFSQYELPSPILSNASGFRLYSTLIQAAVNHMGATIGHTSMIADELDKGKLVPIIDSPIKPSSQYWFITTPNSNRRHHVNQFRKWIFGSLN